MGVDIFKQIITGAFYNAEDFEKGFVENYFEKGETFGEGISNDIVLIQLNPYCDENSILQDYAIGIIEESLPGDSERAAQNAPEVLSVLPDRLESIAKVKDALITLKLYDEVKHPIKTYRIEYFG